MGEKFTCVNVQNSIKGRWQLLVAKLTNVFEAGFGRIIVSDDVGNCPVLDGVNCRAWGGRCNVEGDKPNNYGIPWRMSRREKVMMRTRNRQNRRELKNS